MKLTEFYCLQENRTTQYTIEPDGSLVIWERSSFGDGSEVEDETSFQMLASREDDTFRKLKEVLGLSPDQIEEVWDSWRRIAPNGESLTVSKNGDRLNLDVRVRDDG